MSRRILVVAAHPDDEALGCSGTMARHIAEGDQVSVIFMTNGVGSRGANAREKEERLSAAARASSVIGADLSGVYDFPDNQMDSVPLLEIIQDIESNINNIRPEIIYTHHHGDLNVDHRITHQAVMTACRPQPERCVKEIYSFEVLSSTEWQVPGLQSFTPNVFIDITPYIEIKKNVLDIYSDEMRRPPHSRSIDNTIRTNAVRGNAVGIEYAEAFELLRKIK